jgi:flagellin-like protein
MKILKSRKALSPVVASIILIAVTVAVSLAVAVWMGSLTTGQMQTEGISFLNYAWASPSASTIANITITIKNTGSVDLSVAEVKVDNTVISASNLRFNGNSQQSLPYSLPKGSEVSITIIYAFQRGTTYNFYVRTSRGNVFGPYTLPAP